jgi:hypothetical protein
LLSQLQRKIAEARQHPHHFVMRKIISVAVRGCEMTKIDERTA